MSRSDDIRASVRRILARQFPVPLEAELPTPPAIDENSLHIALELARSNRPDERDMGFARLRRMFPGVEDPVLEDYAGLNVQSPYRVTADNAPCRRAREDGDEN